MYRRRVLFEESTTYYTGLFTSVYGLVHTVIPLISTTRRPNIYIRKEYTYILIYSSIPINSVYIINL